MDLRELLAVCVSQVFGKAARSDKYLQCVAVSASIYIVIKDLYNCSLKIIVRYFCEDANFLYNLNP